MSKKSKRVLSLVAVVFLVFAGVFAFGGVRAAVASGQPIVEHSQEWATGDWINLVLSVFVDDVDGDGVKEIITGGGVLYQSFAVYAQLRVWSWDGTTMTLEKSQEWTVTGGQAYVLSVFVDDVEGDGIKEIITGGNIWDPATGGNGQLRVWNWDGTTLTLEKSQEWRVTGGQATSVSSVFVDDVDNDGVKEIITGGGFYDGTRSNGQLRVWNWDGTTLTLEKSQEWYTLNDTYVTSVFAEDADGDGVKEIITGGYSWDGTSYDGWANRYNGQLRAWNWDGTTLTLQDSEEWVTVSRTYVWSVFVDDVDGDGVKEIITGGTAHDGTRLNGQLRVWGLWKSFGKYLSLQKSQEWYTIGDTRLESVFVDDVDGDGAKEIITGGQGAGGQLRAWRWDGATLTLETSQEWATFSGTDVKSVFVDDVDGDGVKEIITGGDASTSVPVLYYAQLRVWALPLVDSLSVNVDVGTTHFRGEVAEFYVLTSYRGTRINPTQMVSTLYRPDGTTTSLTAQQVAKGFYKIQYTLPSDAPTGAYTLTVEASYKTNAKDLKGANLKTFQLSPTLTQWNAWLLTIQADTGTVKTDIGLIKLSLTDINANITGIRGSTATIETDVGTIKANATDINARITSIDGNIATIETDVGTIQADISTIDTQSIPSIADTQRNQATTQYINAAIAAIAAAGALGTLVLILTKRKQT